MESIITIQVIIKLVFLAFWALLYHSQAFQFCISQTQDSLIVFFQIFGPFDFHLQNQASIFYYRFKEIQKPYF